MASWDATRSTSSVLFASARARPASSRNASRERRQSLRPASATAAGASCSGLVRTSCTVPTISDGQPSGPGTAQVRIITVRRTVLSLSTTRSIVSATVRSTMASATAASIST